MIIHVVNYRAELDGTYGLILTSNSKEKEAVDVALGHRKRGDVGRETLGASLHYADPNILLHLTGTAGGSKINSVGRLVRHMLSAPRPRPAFVFLVGFGWGNPEKTKIGDVMIATEVVAINRRTVSGGTTFQAERPANRLPPIAELASGLPVSTGLSSIVPGPMASLETFLADDAARDELLAQHPDVVGGEMEAYDFLHDCADIPWAVIKGVSDHGGDNPDKAKQSIAASNAASQILPLIDLLTAEGHIVAPAAKGARRQNLEAAIVGEAMSISWSGDLAKLNDYLNDELQETLLMRLQQYAGDQAGEAGLLDALAAFILELVQNSLRHGRSPSVAIDFHETKLVVSDQSPPFALDGLRASEKGGGEAWRALHDRYVEDGLLTIYQTPSDKGNIYSFQFRKLSAELRTAKDRCSATIEPGTIGSQRQHSEILTYADGCETLYVDARWILMYSRRIDLAGAIAIEIEAGKKIFVECGTAEQEAYYQDKLAAYEGPKLHIYVSDRA